MIKEYWPIQGVLYIQYLELVSGSELVSHALEKSGDPRFDELRFIISDWTQVRKTEINPQDVKELVACLVPMSNLCPTARNASVVKRNDTGLGLAAWYRHLGDQVRWPMDIFHDTKEAFDHYQLDFSAIKQYVQ